MYTEDACIDIEITREKREGGERGKGYPHSPVLSIAAFAIDTFIIPFANLTVLFWFLQTFSC